MQFKKNYHLSLCQNVKANKYRVIKFTKTCKCQKIAPVYNTLTLRILIWNIYVVFIDFFQGSTYQGQEDYVL